MEERIPLSGSAASLRPACGTGNVFEQRCNEVCAAPPNEGMELILEVWRRSLYQQASIENWHRPLALLLMLLTLAACDQSMDRSNEPDQVGASSVLTPSNDMPYGELEVPGHPIPSLEVIDVYRTLNSGGADLAIIVATPLGADEQSLARLREKLSRYLAYVRTPEFEQEAGQPTPETVRILVRIHPDSSGDAFALLEDMRERVQDSGATLVIQTTEP